MKEMKEILSSSNYPGRGIIVGMTPEGEAVASYFIMGRSVNSKNRLFEKTGEDIRILPIDPSLCSDPSLIIYYPLKISADRTSVILTNGDQTDTIYDGLKNDESFLSCLEKREYENDSPHFTPRISSLINIDDGSFLLSIIKKDGDSVLREVFSYKQEKGKGRYIHTYVEDGKILPSFKGEPETFSVTSYEEFKKDILSSLPSDKTISFIFLRIREGKVETEIENLRLEEFSR